MEEEVEVEVPPISRVREPGGRSRLMLLSAVEPSGNL